MKIVRVETIHVSLPPRRVHKWTGLTEPIGGYVLLKVHGDGGQVGWGEAPVLKDWCGDYGRYYGETPGTTIHVIERYLAPAVAGADPLNIAELHRSMDAAIKGYPYA
jgi:muconate cycloisomerase